MMKECDMKPREIADAIADGLQDPAIEYWAGMSRGDKEDLVCAVQREEATVAECIDTIRSWADESLRCDSGDDMRTDGDGQETVLTSL